MMVDSKIVLLSSVHPDLLPPIHSIAQAYEAFGYEIYGCSFGYNKSKETVIKRRRVTFNILPVYCGSVIKKLYYQFLFFRNIKSALNNTNVREIFVFCPVSFFWASLIVGTERLVVNCIEIYSPPKALSFDFIFFYYFKRKLKNAANIVSPSIERSIEMVNRFSLKNIPGVLFNAPYLSKALNSNKAVRMPPSRIRIIHTGGLNESRGILELLSGFSQLNENDFELHITNISDSAYSQKVKDFIRCHGLKNVLLLPTLTRKELVELQASAHIGVCFIKQTGSIDTELVAPNKLGEYLVRGLICLVSNQPYFKELGFNSFLISVNINISDEIGVALNKAKLLYADGNYLDEIHHFLQNRYNMEQQLVKNNLL